MSAPRVEIDIRKIEHNASRLVALLAERGIGVTGVTKATLGSPRIAAALVRAGVAAIGESRIENVEAMRHAGLATPMRLIRSPALSQVERAVHHADLSFVTEIDVIRALSSAATAANVTHGIVLMVELGDLREGVMPDDLEAYVGIVLGLPGLSLDGIGTNLACRSGVAPDATNMATLSAMATSIEATFGLHLRIVSGGNSANLNWALDDVDPGRVNDLRLGESILLGCEPLHRTPIPDLYTDAISFVAEVIESKAKPSMPWGDLAQTAFGLRTDPVDHGSTFQTILAAGEQDIDPHGLRAEAGTKILGASSDHLVVDCGELAPVGSEMRFGINYSALLRSMTSPFVEKVLTATPRAVHEHQPPGDGDGDAPTLATVTDIQSRWTRSR
jgi:predicted amino acid racemase